MDILLFVISMALFTFVFAFIGYLGYKKTKTAEDYYVAGRKMGPIVIAFSYGATFISAVALIGFSGIASIYGHSLLWLAFLNIFVGILIAFIFYGFRTRKMGLSLKAVTLPELFGNRFNSKKFQAVSGLIIAIFMIVYTTAVFLAISSLFVVTFGIPYWVCLGLRDIYALDLGAELVTLSGCRTALGREVRGEGLVGLTRGFFSAGASRVVASLWQVRDAASAELMEGFYRALLEEGLPPAAALRQAQLALRRQARYRDPYYWAVFVYQGDWR